MLTLRHLALLLFAASLASLGCHAQAPSATSGHAVVNGQPLPLPLARRIEVLLRQKANLPPAATIDISPAESSGLPGYSSVSITFSSAGNASHPIKFLVSDDGKTLAQFNKFDIPSNPRDLIPVAGRPSRGGPATAPVLIVGFDDLECPFCARMNETIFPALTKRYGNNVHIIYKDFPLTDIHPWAMHAAVDVNCLGAQSPAGYWNLVDYIHAHASDIGTAPTAPTPFKAGTPESKPGNTLDHAEDQLDTLTLEQGKFQKVDIAKLDACIAKQDTTAIKAEQEAGTALNIASTPTLFINGDKIEGAVPIEFIDGIVDNALRAQGITPPPPYIAPPPPAPAVVAKPASPAKKK